MECGMKNESFTIPHSSLLIPHSSLFSSFEISSATCVIGVGYSFFIAFGKIVSKKCRKHHKHYCNYYIHHRKFMFILMLHFTSPIFLYFSTTTANAPISREYLYDMHISLADTI